MKKTLIILLIVATLAALAYGIYSFYGKNNSSKIELSTTLMKQEDIVTEVTATGSVEPVDEVDVGTQVSGLISKIYVDYNSVVKKGQLLATLDITSLNETVKSAQASYDGAMNEVNYQQQQFQRQKKMYNADLISKSDYEEAGYSLKDAQATLRQKKASLSEAKTNLGYAYIYAPINGVVLSKEVEEGQTVTASTSTPTLFTIAKDISHMQVEADVDEADIGQVKKGQRVSFTVDTYPNDTFNGEVTQVRLSPTTSSNVVTYTVIISADNPEAKLKPGLTATITIYTREEKGVNTLTKKAIDFEPNTALLQKYYQQEGINQPIPKIKKNDTQKYIWIKNTDGSIAQKSITTGVNDGVNVIVKSGLSKTDKVVDDLEEIETKTNSSSGESSPFMPTPPKRGGSKKSTPPTP